MIVMIMTSKMILVNQKVHVQMLEVTMNNFISRQALCDDLQEYKIHTVPISLDESEIKGYNDGIDLAISVIAEFPSAEPKRKGKWMDTGCKKIYKCSECGNYLDFDGVNAGRGDVNFCPNCGAEME